MTAINLAAGRNLNGTLPANVFVGLNNLTSLTINGNPGLYGALPSSVGALTQLSTLDVDSNSFNLTLSDVFSNLTKLTYLDVHSNSFTGTLPSSLGLAYNLQYLDASSNKRERLEKAKSALGNFGANRSNGEYAAYIDILSNTTYETLSSASAMVQTQVADVLPSFTQFSFGAQMTSFPTTHAPVSAAE